MHEKFSGVQTDPDTTIVFRQNTTIQGYDVLLEIWVWSDIIAKSAIFFGSDVAALSDEAIIKMVQEEFKTENTTLSRNDAAYVYVNWGLEPIS